MIKEQTIPPLPPASDLIPSSDLIPLTTPSSTDAYTPSSLTPTSDDFGSIQMDYNKPTSPDFMGPAGPAKMTLTGVEPSFETNASDSTANATLAPTNASAASEPDQETLNAAFVKYMGSSFDPNSSMDKGKMETVKNALKKFEEENKRPFKIDVEEDLNKMRPIMNAAYQSEEYKKAAGVGTSRTGGGQTTRKSAAAPRQQTAAQRRAITPVSDKRGPQYLVRDKKRRAYYPAVQADIDSNQPLFMRNPSPNPIARVLNPYVPVDTSKARRARPANQ